MLLSFDFVTEVEMCLIYYKAYKINCKEVPQFGK